jgi:hypothetical protein
VKASLLRIKRALGALALALGVPLLASSCQSLVGIEERELGPCDHFCAVVMKNCTGENQVYESRKKCMALCALLPVGDPIEPQDKPTLSCRLNEAELAATAASETVTEHCRSAGMEGLNCGGGCENYCTIYELACGGVQCGTHETCIEKCGALRDRGAFNLTDDHEGNTLQCRLLHLTNASLDPETHCGHANLSTPSAYCNDLPESYEGEGGASSTEHSDLRPDGPTCKDYCHVETAACGTTQYESEKQCLALCPYFEVGEIADTTQDSLGCRLYHSYNSLCGAEKHCPHAGPGGEGHCGTAETDKCAAYCHLAKGVCGDEYAEKFGTGDAGDVECAKDCAKLDDSGPAEEGPTRYNTEFAATPNTLACRFLAVSRAAENKALCSELSVVGEGDCKE